MVEFLLSFLGSGLGAAVIAFIGKIIINRQLIEHSKEIENIKNELRADLLRHEVYSAISKETYQKLFLEKIEVYKKCIKLKHEIEKDNSEHADDIAYSPYPLKYFVKHTKEIIRISEENPMVISSELADISQNMRQIAYEIWGNANIEQADLYINSESNPDPYSQLEIEEKLDAELFNRCNDFFQNWTEQLEKDVNEIRTALDLTKSFIIKK